MLPAMTTPPPAECSTENNKEKYKLYQPTSCAWDPTQALWSPNVNSCAAGVRCPHLELKPIVRLPPHQSKAFVETGRNINNYSSLISKPQTEKAWQMFFDNLLVDTKSPDGGFPDGRSTDSSTASSSANASTLNSITPQACEGYTSISGTTAVSHSKDNLLSNTSDCSTSSMTVQPLGTALMTTHMIELQRSIDMSDATCDEFSQEEGDLEIDPYRKKWRQNHKAGENAESCGNNCHEVPQILPQVRSTLDLSPAALLMYNAKANLENVCRILMAGANTTNREILGQINNLIGRLETGPGLVLPMQNSPLTYREENSYLKSSSKYSEKGEMDKNDHLSSDSFKGLSDSLPKYSNIFQTMKLIKILMQTKQQSNQANPMERATF